MLVFFVTQINYNIQGDQKIPGFFFFYYLNMQILIPMLYTCPISPAIFEAVLKVFNFKLFE